MCSPLRSRGRSIPRVAGIEDGTSSPTGGVRSRRRPPESLNPLVVGRHRFRGSCAPLRRPPRPPRRASSRRQGLDRPSIEGGRRHSARWGAPLLRPRVFREPAGGEARSRRSDDRSTSDLWISAVRTSGVIKPISPFHVETILPLRAGQRRATGVRLPPPVWRSVRSISRRPGGRRCRRDTADHTGSPCQRITNLRRSSGWLTRTTAGGVSDHALPRARDLRLAPGSTA